MPIDASRAARVEVSAFTTGIDARCSSRASDGRDSWKVTAVQTLDLCLVGDFGLSRRHSGERSGEKGETRHDLLCSAERAESVLKKIGEAGRS